MNVILVSTPPDQSSGTGQYTEQLSKPLQDRVSIEREFIPTDARSPLPFLRTIMAIIRADSDLVHIQYDYVIFGPRGIYTWLFFPLLFLVSRRRSVPIVVTVHEVLNANLVTAPFRRLKQMYVAGMNRLVAGTADYLLFLSEEAMSRFSSSVSVEHTSHIPHGVQDVPVETNWRGSAEQFDFDQDDVVVVAPGYVSPRKGSDVVVDLAEQRPEWTFLLAGGPPRWTHAPFFERLQERAPDNVTITGRLPESSFHAAFIAADVAVLPYRETTQRGVVNTVNQSGVFNWCAAHRLPVAATDCPRFRAVNDRWDCPSLFDVSDLSDVERVLEDLLSEEAQTRARSNLAAYAAANDMESIADRHVELYEEVVG